MHYIYYIHVKTVAQFAQPKLMLPRFNMKIALKILFAPLLWLLHACSPLGNPVDEEKSDNHYYNKQKTDIRFSRMGNWFELGNSPMNADVESFEVLNKNFAKDKDQVYYEANAVEKGAVDLGSFHVKDNKYMTWVGLDKNQVYTFEKVYGKSNEGTKSFPVEGADPKTYTHTDWDWAHDGKNHFYRFQMISVDFKSFQNLTESFSTDKDSVYFHRSGFFRSIKADVESFEVLHKNYFARDKNNVYYAVFVPNETETQLLEIPIKNQEKVALLNEAYVKVGNQVYYGATPIDLHSEFAEVLSTYYIKDKLKVYYQDRLLADADAESFGLIGEFQIGDKNGPFRAGERIEKEQSKP